MRYSVKANYGPALYAFSIEASNEGSAYEVAATQLPHRADSVGMLTEPLLVHEDGRVVMNGDHIACGDEEWRFDGKELPRHAGSTGRVIVSRVCGGCAEGSGHLSWCRLRETREFFPNVFDLHWVMPVE